MEKCKITEIVPAEDVLLDEMKAIKGGWELHLCFSGCKTGDKNEGSKPKPDTITSTDKPGVNS